jgi:hypothetical protein
VKDERKRERERYLKEARGKRWQEEKFEMTLR